MIRENEPMAISPLSITRRALAGGMASAVGLAAASGGAAAENVTLRVTTNGGDFEQFETRYLDDRFTADTGIRLVRIAANPPDQVQKLIASRGRPVPFDVAGLDDKTQPEAIGAGTLAKIDPKIVTNLAFLVRSRQAAGRLWTGCTVLVVGADLQPEGAPRSRHSGPDLMGRSVGSTARGQGCDF